MRRIILLVIFILSGLSLFSQRAYFEKDNIYIGDQIKFTLEISQNKGKEIQFPEFENVIIEGIEILSSFENKEDNDRLYKEYIITSFEDSLFLLHPFEFIVDGKTLKTNATKLKVQYYKPDSVFISKIDTTQQLPVTDIKDLVDEPFTFKEFINRFWIYIVILLLTTAVFLLIRFILKKKKEGDAIITKIKPKVPVHVIALESINKLKSENLHKKEDLKPFYTRLSTIIRIYIEDRFEIPAMESVTVEIMEAFEKTSFWKHDIDGKLRVLLALSDMVKFAKNNPDDHENELMFEYAVSFIENTIEEIVIDNESFIESVD